MARSVCRSAAALVVCAWATGAAADPDPAFAQQLMRERDYFRAITVYKELAFREPDAERRDHHRHHRGRPHDRATPLRVLHARERRHEHLADVLGELHHADQVLR